MSTFLIILLFLVTSSVCGTEYEIAKTAICDKDSAESIHFQKSESSNIFVTLPPDLAYPIILEVANANYFKTIHNLQYVDTWWYNACAFYREGGISKSFKELWQNWQGYKKIHKLEKWKEHPLQQNNKSLHNYLYKTFFGIYYNFFMLEYGTAYKAVEQQIKALINYAYLNPNMKYNDYTLLQRSLVFGSLREEVKNEASSFYEMWLQLFARGEEYGIKRLIPGIDRVSPYILKAIIKYDNTIVTKMITTVLDKIRTDLTKKNINYRKYDRYFSNLAYLLNLQNNDAFIINNQHCLALNVFPKVFKTVCLLLRKNEERMWQKEPTRTTLPFLLKCGCNRNSRKDLVICFSPIMEGVSEIFSNRYRRAMHNEIEPEITQYLSDYKRVIEDSIAQNYQDKWIQCSQCKKFDIYRVDIHNWVRILAMVKFIPDFLDFMEQCPNDAQLRIYQQLL